MTCLLKKYNTFSHITAHYIILYLFTEVLPSNRVSTFLWITLYTLLESSIHSLRLQYLYIEFCTIIYFLTAYFTSLLTTLPSYNVPYLLKEYYSFIEGTIPSHRVWYPLTEFCTFLQSILLPYKELCILRVTLTIIQSFVA